MAEMMICMYMYVYIYNLTQVSLHYPQVAWSVDVTVHWPFTAVFIRRTSVVFRHCSRLRMAAFIAKQMVGNKLSSVKGQSLYFISILTVSCILSSVFLLSVFCPHILSSVLCRQYSVVRILSEVFCPQYSVIGILSPVLCGQYSVINILPSVFCCQYSSHQYFVVSILKLWYCIEAYL